MNIYILKSYDFNDEPYLHGAYSTKDNAIKAYKKIMLYLGIKKHIDYVIMELTVDAMDNPFHESLNLWKSKDNFKTRRKLI